MGGHEAPPSVFILGEGGSIFEMDLPLPAAIADRLTKGYLRQVNEDGSPFLDEAPAGVPAPPTERPAVTANKPEWVAWAVVQGATPDDAEAMTKADLIDKYGTRDAPPAPTA